VWDQVWRQLLASGLMALVCGTLLPVWSKSLPMMFVGCVSSVLIYAAALWVIGKDKVLREVQSLRKR
jgi:hypothetical protein